MNRATRSRRTVAEVGWLQVNRWQDERHGLMNDDRLCGVIIIFIIHTHTHTHTHINQSISTCCHCLLGRLICLRGGRWLGAKTRTHARTRRQVRWNDDAPPVRTPQQPDCAVWEFQSAVKPQFHQRSSASTSSYNTTQSRRRQTQGASNL